MRLSGLLCSVALVAPAVLAYPNGIAQKPAMGWNTWCTEATCDQPEGVVPPHAGSMHDVCNYDEMMGVARAMLENGMYELGFAAAHADDCWAATGRDAHGNLFADPNRFPTGWAGLAADLAALGFTNGLYTSTGNTTCSSGQRNGTVPGSAGHYAQDAATFASWGVDYVKIDFCGDDAPNAKAQHTAFSNGLNATGKPIWLELCRGYDYPPPAYTQEVAQSARIAGDHSDSWINTVGVVELMAIAADTGLSGTTQGYWGYGDVLMTGGAGCGTNTTEHCPGMTDLEYETEFAMWTITSSPLIVATDLRNMTAVMKKLLLNPEIIAVNQDVASPPGRRLGFGNCTWLPLACQLWGRNMSDGTAVIALYNADATAHDITFDFSLLGDSWAGQSVYVRDLLERADDGKASGSLTSSLAPHAVKYARISLKPVAPLDVPRRQLTDAAKRLLGRQD